MGNTNSVKIAEVKNAANDNSCERFLHFAARAVTKGHRDEAN